MSGSAGCYRPCSPYPSDFRWPSGAAPRSPRCSGPCWRWLLFDTSKQNISLHIRNILADGKLAEAATVKESLTVQTEGKHQVRRRNLLYSLDMILAVGYRVCSPRGTQFRQWATPHLREYLVKSFVLDDARLKEPGGWDYIQFNLLVVLNLSDIFGRCLGASSQGLTGAVSSLGRVTSLRPLRRLI